MFGQIFNPNNAFFRPFGKLVDLVTLSVLWTVTSLLLVTMGPASAAIYRACVRSIRCGQSLTPVQDYLEAFRRNFKVGALTMLVLLPILYLVWVWHNLLFYYAMNDSIGVMLYCGFCVLILLGAGILSYIFPTLSRFEFQVRDLLTNCLRLAFVHLPSTLVLGVITLATAWVCINFLLTLVFLPALAALLQSLLLERIFRPYLEGPGTTDEEDESEL